MATIRRYACIRTGKQSDNAKKIEQCICNEKQKYEMSLHYYEGYAACDLHFHEEDIAKDVVQKVHDDVVVTLRDKSALKEDAMLRIFPNSPK